MSDTATKMQSITPLGGREPRVDSHHGATLHEITNLAIASFSARLGQEVEARRKLAGFIEIALPEPGKMSRTSFCSFWIAPDQWMITALHENYENLSAELVAVAGGAASITEQNDAWCCFELAGPDLVSVFELLCPMDLRACTGGEATRTSIDHLSCFVLVLAPEKVRVLGPRSSAGSLHHALLTAMYAAL